MGTDAHVVAVGGTSSDLDAAVARLEQLEAMWSRFRPGSDVAGLNAAGGAPVAVAPETFDLIALAVERWAATDGMFDPTVLPNLVAAGYDRSFELVAAGPVDVRPARGPAPGCAGVGLGWDGTTVTLPPGVFLDLGGIGKGRAVDLLAADLAAAGVDGFCVNLGGDLRVGGVAPAEEAAWSVAVEVPGSGAEVRVGLACGALATSTTAKRRWAGGHHLIDPRTGSPAESDLVSASVVAAEAADADVLAKTVLLGGRADVPALVVDRWGGRTMLNGFEEFCW